MPDDIFTTAPKPVRRYFDEKKQRPTFDWRDIAPEEHAHSFTVAKSTGYDVLDDIRRATSDAIANQKAFKDFAAELEPVLREKGWWGKKWAIDPKTGEKTLVQLGSPRRLRTIHWANVSTARAAGEWERTLATKKFLPFLRYTLSRAENKRPEHRAWVGIVLPVDHPWWLTHYPPNGWLCRCGVRQITKAQAERDGYVEDQSGPEIDMRPWFNKRTGKKEWVPVGIDPGWQTHPGINRGKKLMTIYQDKLEAMPDKAAAAALKTFWSGAEPRLWLNQKQRMHLPVARSSRAKELFDGQGSMIAISNSTANVKLGKHKVLREEILANANDMVQQGEWHQGTKPGAIDIFSEYGGNLWKLVLTVSEDGYLYFRTIHPTGNKRKRGMKID